jgi:hypothetical protein
VWVTAQALMALDRKPLPLAAVALRHAAGAQPSKHGAARAAAPVHVRHASSHRRGSTPHHPGRRRSTRPAQAPTLDVYAAGAGLLTALALAPVGIG